MSLPSASDEMTMYRRPVELLQQLIRFDTTNPPGNEAACIGYVSALLRAQGIEPLLLARDPARPNLVARIAGEGTAPPLLLYGHVDVVTTAEQTWQHPPFAGVVAGGYVWGRGALDMKGGGRAHSCGGGWLWRRGSLQGAADIRACLMEGRLARD